MMIAIWALVKGFVDPQTREKLAVLGTDFHSDLRFRIPAHVLPLSFGGTYCPPSWVVLNDDGEPEKETTVVVAARSSYELRVRLETAERIDVTWCVKSLDVGFSVTRESVAAIAADTNTSEKEIVVESLNVTSEDGEQVAAVDGLLFAPCVVTFLWDNTYSWLRTKPLWLRVAMGTMSEDGDDE